MDQGATVMPDTLAEIQNRAIREALERNGGRTTWAAEELDVSIRTIARWKVTHRWKKTVNLASSDNLTNGVTIDVADH
jgi:transcriptional regulator with PAS, ATPase and Fis domain